MGRIKTKKVKTVSEELVNRYGDKLTEDYSTNKEIIGQVADIPSKKMKNMIAGYVTRLVKTNKEI